MPIRSIPDRIVVGAADERHAGSHARALPTRWWRRASTPPPGVPRPPAMTAVPLVTTTLTSAEMIKYAANAFLAMKIGFANEIANICERVGAEATEVMAGHRPRFAHRREVPQPRRGLGRQLLRQGHPVAAAHRARVRLSEQAAAGRRWKSTRAQRQMVIQKLQEKLFILKGRTIGLLGLAFKPDTDDLRDAPSLHIAERLLQMGARVKAYDPIAMPPAASSVPI